MRTVHFQHAQRALVERAKQRVIHQDVRAGHFDFEFHNRRSARRNNGRLHVVRRLRAGLRINRVEDFADDVEGASEVRSAIADEQTNFLSDFCGKRLVADKRADRAVEDNVGRFFIRSLVHVECLEPLLAIFAGGVKLALHHVILTVRRRQTFLRLNENQTIHAVADVHAHRRGRAVINVESRIERLE